ncbi:MAG TPA: PIN domain-containing protein [Polyangia bacterium]
MKRAYVDTSALIAVQFGEPARPRVLAVLRSHDELVSTSLFGAEMLAALGRAALPLQAADRLLGRLARFIPPDDLRGECEQALAAGALRGADLWHVAAALRLAGRHRKRLTFCTLDQTQRGVAAALGFPVRP